MNFDSLVKIIAFGVSLTAFLGIMWKIFKKTDEIVSNRDEIEKMKTEQQMLCYGMLACLDGLKQLGANGNVTKAHNALEKHINIQAHE